MNELIHIHEEQREPDPVYRLWDRARNAARKRDLLPVVAVRSTEFPGRLLIIHEADLAALIGTL